MSNLQSKLIVGLSLHRSDGDAELFASSISVAGRGLRMRPKHLVSASETLPDHLTKTLSRIHTDAKIDALVLNGLRCEIAEMATTLIERTAAGFQGAHQCLAAAVADYTLRIDGETVLNLGVCDATLLSERTGLNIIDDFASRDAASGGTGEVAFLLPLWMMLAERGESSGDRGGRLTVECEAVDEAFRFHLTYLPPHMVLADWLPPIDCRAYDSAIEVVAAIEQFSFATSSTYSEDAYSEDTKTENLLWPNLNSVVIWGDEFAALDLTEQLQAQCGTLQVLPLRDLGFSPEQLSSATAAVLGALVFDHEPANMPHITGAHTRRVLGRITPGNPINWTALLREMYRAQPDRMSLLRAM